MSGVLYTVKTQVRRVMRSIASVLNTVSGGRITPNMVTITGLLAHLPIVYLIGKGELVWAGVLLIIFGLFDALDGELARLQKRDGPAGMFLDSVTDRMKEIIIYVGIVIAAMQNMVEGCGSSVSAKYCIHDQGYVVELVLVALGVSLLTTYINAWGEVVLQRAGKQGKTTNKVFRGGLAPFEIRMTLIILGLLTGELELAVLVIAVLATITVFMRIRKVYKALSGV